MAAKKKTVEGFNPVDQIESYLNAHKDEHFNFEEENGQATAGGCRGLLGLCCWVGSLILNLDH